MDDERRIEIEEAEDAAPEEHGIEPVSEAELDIEAAIDEAVQAVEEAARKREADAPTGPGEDGDAAQVELLQAEIDALRDRSLRTLADFDNFRKRVERERGDERKYASIELLREVLGIVDNLERALSAEGSMEDLKAGVQMILKQMEDVLERSGVTRVEALDREFDPSVHEAVSRLEDSGVDVPTVIDEFQPGYTLHERLLRPSIVRVAVPSDAGAGDEDEAPEPADDGAEELTN